MITIIKRIRMMIMIVIVIMIIIIRRRKRIRKKSVFRTKYSKISKKKQWRITLIDFVNTIRP